MNRQEFDEALKAILPAGEVYEEVSALVDDFWYSTVEKYYTVGYDVGHRMADK